MRAPRAAAVAGRPRAKLRRARRGRYLNFFAWLQSDALPVYDPAARETYIDGSPICDGPPPCRILRCAEFTIGRGSARGAAGDGFARLNTSTPTGAAALAAARTPRPLTQPVRPLLSDLSGLNVDLLSGVYAALAAVPAVGTTALVVELVYMDDATLAAPDASNRALSTLLLPLDNSTQCAAAANRRRRGPAHVLPARAAARGRAGC